jgi:hypothetical protein
MQCFLDGLPDRFLSAELSVFTAAFRFADMMKCAPIVEKLLSSPGFFHPAFQCTVTPEPRRLFKMYQR